MCMCIGETRTKSNLPDIALLSMTRARTRQAPKRSTSDRLIGSVPCQMVFDRFPFIIEEFFVFVCMCVYVCSRRLNFPVFSDLFLIVWPAERTYRAVLQQLCTDRWAKGADCVLQALINCILIGSSCPTLVSMVRFAPPRHRDKRTMFCTRLSPLFYDGNGARPINTTVINMSASPHTHYV